MFVVVVVLILVLVCVLFIDHVQEEGVYQGHEEKKDEPPAQITKGQAIHHHHQH